MHINNNIILRACNNSRGNQGGPKEQRSRSCFNLDSSHAQTLVLTDAPTPFLATPLVPLKIMIADLHFNGEVKIGVEVSIRNR